MLVLSGDLFEIRERICGHHRIYAYANVSGSHGMVSGRGQEGIAGDKDVGGSFYHARLPLPTFTLLCG